MIFVLEKESFLDEINPSPDIFLSDPTWLPYHVILIGVVIVFLIGTGISVYACLKLFDLR